MCPVAQAAEPQEMNLSEPNKVAQTAGGLVAELLLYSALVWALVLNEGCLEETSDTFLASGNMEHYCSASALSRRNHSCVYERLGFFRCSEVNSLWKRLLVPANLFLYNQMTHPQK